MTQVSPHGHQSAGQRPWQPPLPPRQCAGGTGPGARGRWAAVTTEAMTYLHPCHRMIIDDDTRASIAPGEEGMAYTGRGGMVPTQSPEAGWPIAGDRWWRRVRICTLLRCAHVSALWDTTRSGQA